MPLSFWEAPTHASIINFSNFLLQLKNQTSGSKTVFGFSVIFILKKGFKVKEFMLFVEQKYQV